MKTNFQMLCYMEIMKVIWDPSEFMNGSRNGNGNKAFTGESSYVTPFTIRFMVMVVDVIF